MATPVTTPVVLMVAFVGMLLLHVPPVVSCASVSEASVHTDVADAVMAAGPLTTVTSFVV